MVSKQRSVLSSCLTRQATVIKSLSLPQVTFLQTVHDVELMRMESGHPSVLLDYFCNESVNESEMLPVLDAIADKVSCTAQVGDIEAS
jgi:phosphatidylinositol 4-kinase